MKITIESRFSEQYKCWIAETSCSVVDVAPATADDESTAVHIALELLRSELEYNGFVSTTKD